MLAMTRTGAIANRTEETMINRSQKILDVMKPDTDISGKTTRRCDLPSAEQRSPEGDPQDGRQMWKDLFLETMFFEALLESDKEKLTEMLQAAEQVMALRAQDLLNSSNRHEERAEMDTALAAVLSIKKRTLGRPAVFARDGSS
jgi:hypothetical protein